MQAKVHTDFFKKKKEAAIIVYSSRDDNDSAIKFKSNIRFYEDKGIVFLHKKKITNRTDANEWICKELLDKIKNTSRVKDAEEFHIKVIIHAHGTAGWLLGGGANHGLEMEHEELLNFAEKIREIEDAYPVKVDSIDIKACYAAAEFFNLNTDDNNVGVLFSPARHLSFMLPDILITAPISSFSDVGVSVFDSYKNENVFTKSGIATFKNGKGHFPEGVNKKIYHPPLDGGYSSKMLKEAGIPDENRVFVNALKECREINAAIADSCPSLSLLVKSKEYGKGLVSSTSRLTAS